jgi:hypothetical protein
VGRIDRIAQRRRYLAEQPAQLFVVVDDENGGPAFTAI